MVERRRHVAERSCVGCRRRGPKVSFIRLARTAASEVIIDVDGRGQGRGAYLCRSADCLEKARGKRAFKRALMVDEGIIPYEALISAIEQSDPVDG